MVSLAVDIVGQGGSLLIDRYLCFVECGRLLMSNAPCVMERSLGISCVKVVSSPYCSTISSQKLRHYLVFPVHDVF